MEDQFENIRLTKHNLDRYFVRKSIFTALSNNCKDFYGDFLDVGCGKMPYKDYLRSNSKIARYIGLDIEGALDYGNVSADYLWDGITMPFKEGSFQTIMATEVLEHCPDPLITLMEINRVMDTNGIFFFTVPFLWPLHEVPHDEFRYTPFSLERMLTKSGFVDINIQALGGANAGLAIILGLWLNRYRKNNISTRVIRNILYPFIRYLIRKDRTPQEFTESTLITGLFGTARKSNSSV